MVRSAWEKLMAWWASKWPAIRSKTVELADEWWVDIGDKPRPHFVSMVAGILIYLTVKLAVTLAA
jgi:hypothetical protein